MLSRAVRLVAARTRAVMRVPARQLQTVAARRIAAPATTVRAVTAAAAATAALGGAAWYATAPAARADAKAATAPAPSPASTAAGAKKPVRILLFGATGRTGIHYLPAALAAGYEVTCFVRNAKGIDAASAAHPRCRIVTGALNDVAAVTQAVRAARPDVVVSMLASDPKPHTAMSDATRSLLAALDAVNRDTATTDGVKPHFFSISAWGIEPTQPYMPSLDRRLIALALKFYPAGKDFTLQTQLLSSAQAQQLLPPDSKQTFILPPFLSNGARRGLDSGKVRWGDLKDVHDLRSWYVVSRLDMADVVLRLTDDVAAGKPVPKYVPLYNA